MNFELRSMNSEMWNMNYEVTTGLSNILFPTSTFLLYNSQF